MDDLTAEAQRRRENKAQPTIEIQGTDEAMPSRMEVDKREWANFETDPLPSDGRDSMSHQGSRFVPLKRGASSPALRAPSPPLGVEERAGGEEVAVDSQWIGDFSNRRFMERDGERATLSLATTNTS